MVTIKKETQEEATVSSVSDNEIINFDANNFIWHGTFGDSAHPNYNRVAMMKFLELFSKKPKIPFS